MSTRPPTRRTVLAGLALATTGAALTRRLPALDLSEAAVAAHDPAQNSIDPMRPQYHLLPTHGWMNDPCGPLFWTGRYHMFYQYNSEPISAVKLWAHATSSDMVHWRREPIALAPTPGGPDADGCWTGTAAIVDGKPTFLYTGVVNSTPEQATLADSNPPLRESVCMAVAEDDTLLHWRKLPQPVMPAPPAGMKVVGFRDPSPWREGNHWNLIVASGERGAGGRVLLYRSADFLHWEYLHPMAQGKPNGKQGTDPVDSGEMWECPDFFPLDGKHVLIHSTERRTLWQIGTLDPATMLFHAESEGLLDHGAYYAPKSQLDVHGNRILWGWITETRPQAEYAAAGWSGMMSLPRRLSIADGQLVMAPSPEIESLRTAPRTTWTAVKRLPTAAQEIRLGLQPAEPRTDAFEQSFVDNQGAAILLRADPQQSPGTVRIGDHELSGIDKGPLDLHIFLDHSVAEIFLNHRRAITHRYYSRTPMEPAVAITLGGNWRITQQQAWSLKSIW
ncbi:MAG TPA: glycoside hydrolase family 32 protein [Acidobacteriaceae bacterium]|nr:glycoside hydrolase family 32 protein [Acidobacteriaceae bacterium]